MVFTLPAFFKKNSIMAKKKVAVKVKGKPVSKNTPVNITPRQSVVATFHLKPK